MTQHSASAFLIAMAMTLAAPVSAAALSYEPDPLASSFATPDPATPVGIGNAHTASPGGPDRSGVESVLYDDGNTLVVRMEDGWVRWSGNHDPTAAQNHYEGTLGQDGNCVFTFHHIAVPGEIPDGKVILEKEIGYNDSTCEMIMTLGYEDESNVGLRPSQGPSEAGIDKGVYQQLRYVDPPGWTVNWTASDLIWSYAGSCVTWTSHAWDDGWMSHTGWSRDSFDHSTEFGCSLARTKTWGQYKNLLFCNPLAWTYTKYYYNTVTGYGTGFKGYGASATKWGDCASLLSLEMIRR